MSPIIRGFMWKIFSVSVNIFAGIFVLYGVLFAVKSLVAAPSVQASSSVYYPNFCLGGWEHPQYASGEPMIDPRISDGGLSYDKINSAFLDSATAAQMFCGYFSVQDKTNPPTSVKIAFNWSMRWPNQIPTTQVLDNNTSTIPAENFPLNQPIQGSTVLPVSVPVNPQTSVQIIPVDVVPDTSPPVDGSVQPEPTPSPAPSIPTDSAPQTFNSDSSLSSFIAGLISEKVHAQETLPEDFGNAFLQISYSMDGIRWTSIGRVSRINWQNYSVNIPIKSWNDLKHLQIMVSIIPSIDEKPDIYFESMEVSANYKKTLTEAAGDSLASVGEAVGLLDIADPVAPELPVDIAAQVAEQEVQEVVPPLPPPPIKVKHLTFALNGQHISSQTTLPWQDDLFQKSLVEEHFAKKKISDKIENAGKSFYIQGSCKKEYFVVLIYRNPTDYIKKPSSFVSNQAELCKNSAFSYDLGVIPTNIPDGEYYLLVAEQDTTGPWAPSTDIIPITVGSVIEEIPQNI